ncbi:50S ribosomal protein L17 [bacterium]|nr:50S ribosomal protein L17 [bacterium]MCK4326764.1 50S ribosomal protein L17 [bacterium]MCK4436474.1 50S ribosomal protein L17 [bacterium]
MRHRKAGRKLGRTKSHRKALLGNLLKGLFEHERIKTTVAKGKEIASLADKLMGLAKRGDLRARRQVGEFVRDKKLISKLFNDIAPRLTERKSGYTRLRRLSPRLGDAASLVLVELVERREEKEKSKRKKKEKKS